MTPSKRPRTPHPATVPLRALPPRRNGRLTLRMVPVPADKFRVSLLHESLPPHSDTPPIYHKSTEEVAFVIKGRAAAFLNGRRVPLKAGDTLHIPAGVEHRFVTGESGIEALSLFSPALDPRRPDAHPGKDPVTGKRLKRAAVSLGNPRPRTRS